MDTMSNGLWNFWKMKTWAFRLVKLNSWLQLHFLHDSCIKFSPNLLNYCVNEANGFENKNLFKSRFLFYSLSFDSVFAFFSKPTCIFFSSVFEIMIGSNSPEMAIQQLLIKNFCDLFGLTHWVVHRPWRCISKSPNTKRNRESHDVWYFDFTWKIVENSIWVKSNWWNIGSIQFSGRIKVLPMPD